MRNRFITLYVVMLTVFMVRSTSKESIRIDASIDDASESKESIHPKLFRSGSLGLLNVFFGTRWQMAALADGGKVTKLPHAYNAPPRLGLTWNGLGIRVLGGMLSRNHGLPEGILMENRSIHFMGGKEKVCGGIFYLLFSC